MKLGVVKIRNCKDGVQSGYYTSISDRLIVADNKIKFHPDHFSELMQEEEVARNYPE